MLLKIALVILNLTGLNPLKYDARSRIRRYLFYICLSILIMFMIIGTCLQYDGLPAIIRFSEMFPALYQTVWKLAVLVTKKDDFEEAITMSKKFWTCDILNRKAKSEVDHVFTLATKFYKSYLVLSILSGIEYYGNPLFTGSGQLPIIFYLEGVHPYHTYLYVYQLCVVPMIFSVFMGFDGLFLFYVTSIIAEFKIIREVFSGCNLKTTRAITFEETVAHHSFLIDFIKKISDLYAYTFMLLMYIGFMYMCFGLFLMTKDGLPPSLDNFIQNLPFIIFFLVQLSFYCAVGQIIMDESTRIADVFFYKNWLSRSQYENKLGKIMVTRISQKGQYLSVGGYFPLNLETYGWVMVNVKSVFTFMQALFHARSWKGR